jgi:pyruvate-ferredoxin/flavodoxin oxidoreductase
MTKKFETIDGNEAAARLAYQLNEVIALFPITPASPMGESADAWSAAGVKNLWGTVHVELTAYPWPPFISLWDTKVYL